jgi:hypothetical protein
LNDLTKNVLAMGFFFFFAKDYFKEFGFNLQRLLNPQCFNLSFPQRIWAWVDKKKKEHVHSN